MGIVSKLRAGGPDRSWQRFLVLEEGIGMVENEDNRQEENNFAGSPSSDP